MSKRTFSGTEADLCAAFIEQFNALPGWTCYPETAGFDVLVVHDDGRQIGVEAKLKLNAKVADQILPDAWAIRCGAPGPDHRMVIVGDITEASLGIVKMLEALGVAVLKPYMQHRYTKESGLREHEYFPDFQIGDWIRRGHAWKPQLDDWNPVERCKVPIVVPDVPAGVPAPMRFTPWKEAALKVLIQLRRQGFITAKQITEHGISSTVWTQGPTAWLQKGPVPGQWVASDRLPAFDKQHPEAYEKLLLLEQEKTVAQQGLELTAAGGQ